MLQEKMIEEGVYTPPEPYFNLKWGRTYTNAVYQRAILEDVPEENLELLRQFMDDCEWLMEQAEAEQPMAAPAVAAPAMPAAPAIAAPTQPLQLAAPAAPAV